MVKLICQAHFCADKILNSPDLFKLIGKNKYEELEIKVRDDVKENGAGYLAYDFKFILECVAEKLEKCLFFETKKVLDGADIFVYLSKNEKDRHLKVEYGRKAQRLYKLFEEFNKILKESIHLYFDNNYCNQFELNK